MRIGPDGRALDPDDEIVGADVRELLAADDGRVPPDLHAAVAAMAREAQGLPGGAAALPPGALPRWQRLVPIAAVLAISAGLVPLVVRDAPTGAEEESVALESVPAPVAEADRAAVVAGTAAAREAPVVADAAPPEALVREAPGAHAEPVPMLAPVPVSEPDGVPGIASDGESRDGARRVIERLRERGVDAALESYAAWRASWPDADLAELAGEAGDDELERLREAVSRRGLAPLSPPP